VIGWRRRERSAPLVAPPPSIPDFDPTRDGIYEREVIETLREDLHRTSLRLENIQEDMKRLEQRNAYLEGEAEAFGAAPYECPESQDPAQAATGPEGKTPIAATIRRCHTALL